MSKALANRPRNRARHALAVPAHAAEKVDADAFILGCIWTGDHKRTVCGEFTTRASCEREGRAAVASGELSKFECISAVTIDWGALFDEGFRRIFEEPTAAGPGGSDQPTFGRLPVRTATPDPVAQYHQQMDDPGFRWMRKVAGPSAPDRWHGLPPPLPSGGWTNAAQGPPPTATLIRAAPAAADPDSAAATRRDTAGLDNRGGAASGWGLG